MDSPKLLLVDDDVKFCRLLREYLQPLGYSVDAVHVGTEGLQHARDGAYAAVFLDVMLPRMSGWDVLRELRKYSSVPVLMLTALGDEVDRIAGLESGADDYVPKTFSMRELLARLRAVLRRSRMSELVDRAAPANISVGAVTIDAEARTVLVNESPVVLTATEFDLLLALARCAGRVRSREQLLLDVAERDFDVFDRSIDVHIVSIRRKLGDDARSPQLIETVRGVGYRMVSGKEMA